MQNGFVAHRTSQANLANSPSVLVELMSKRQSTPTAHPSLRFLEIINSTPPRSSPGQISQLVLVDAQSLLRNAIALTRH